MYAEAVLGLWGAAYEGLGFGGGAVTLLGYCSSWLDLEGMFSIQYRYRG